MPRHQPANMNTEYFNPNSETCWIAPTSKDYTRAVIQILADGTEVPFNGIREAGRATGVTEGKIRNAASRKQKAGGYLWRYK